MKKIFVFCVLALTASSLIFAGGSQAGAGGGNAALTGPGDWTYKYPEPVTVTIGRGGAHMLTNYFEGETFENNAYTRWLKEKYNIVVKTGFLAQDADILQRVTLAIASGDLPDLLIVPNNQQQAVELMQSGMAEDLTGLYDKWGSPLLKASIETFGGLEAAMPSTFMNGRQLSFTATNCSGQDSLFWVREDWRLKLGLPEPKTLDDFVALAEAFVKNDMAGNGTTTGMEIMSPFAGEYNAEMKADPWFAEVGAYPRLWVDGPDGKITYGSVSPQAKEGLRTLRDMYARGVLPQDYVTKDHRAALAAGQIGVVPGPWWISDVSINLTINNNPNADWKPYTWTSTKSGKRHTFQPQINNSWTVMRKGYAHPELAVRFQNVCVEVRAYYDGPMFTAAEERQFQMVIPPEVRDAYAGRQFINWVSWPTSVQVDFNDMIPRLARMEKLNLERYQAGDRSGMDAPTLATIAGVDNWQTGKDKGFDSWKYNARYTGKQFSAIDANTIQIEKTYWPVNTDTMTLRWANLRDLETTAYNQIVMGQRPLDYFDTFVREWRAQGGDAIIREVNEQYGR